MNYTEGFIVSINAVTKTVKAKGGKQRFLTSAGENDKGGYKGIYKLRKPEAIQST